jgi:hypothetical protein
MSSTVDRRVFAIHFTGSEAIEEVIMPIHIRCRDKGAASIQHLDINRFTVIGTREALASYPDREPYLRILCGDS